MIGERVKVCKADGHVYYGIALRWEDRVMVIKPEDGTAVEKRAYLPHDSVFLARGVVEQTEKPDYKSLVAEMGTKKVGYRDLLEKINDDTKPAS